MAEKILEVKDLAVSFKTDNGLVKAVRNVSFDLERGETLCIVGESGSGKSVTSKAIMGILASNAVVENGQIMYEGENLLEVSEEEFHKIRGHKIGMIFQDPLSSLNPIVRIGKQITEATLVNGNKIKKLYDSIISKDLTKYKNACTRKQVKLDKLANQLEKKIEEANKDKTLISQAKEQYKSDVLKVKEEFDSIIPALKEKLNETKAKAKVEIKQYKAKIKAEHVENLNVIKADITANKLGFKDNFMPFTKIWFSKVYTSVAKYFVRSISSESKRIGKLEDKHQARLANFYETVKGRKEIDERLEAENIRYIDLLKVSKRAAKAKALEIMREVGIPQPEKRFRQYPFEFSGGMRQRIVIAIALTATPEILICDEPTTALDVTIQAQILELIKKIQAERNIACIFITHDLGVVANMADRVAVMYAGKIVEYGKSTEIFYEPKHPYTWALLSSIPDVDSKERLEAIPGTPPNMIYPPKGDAFALRSKYAMKIDFEEQPPYFKVSDTHFAATWLLHPNAPKVKMPKIVVQRIINALQNDDSDNARRILSELQEQREGGLANE